MQKYLTWALFGGTGFELLCIQNKREESDSTNEMVLNKLSCRPWLDIELKTRTIMMWALSSEPFLKKTKARGK